MSERTLFGIIAILLLSISGVGIYAALQHPEAVASLAPRAVSLVGDALGVGTPAQNTTVAPSNTTSTVSKDSDDDGDANDDTDDDGDGAATTQKSTTSTNSAQSASGGYTMAQVAAHPSASSCYTAINGSVYDLTSFINQHPGGRSAILSLCGVDGTSAFMAQHGGQGRPERELASLLIGSLAK